MCLVVGLWMVGSVWAGEAGAAAAPEVTVEAAVEATATPAPAPSATFADANAKAAARLDGLKDLELVELNKLLKQTNESLPALGKSSSELSAELREARNKADREAEEVRALYKQIAEIQAQIAAVTDTLPGVREKLDAYNAAQATLFEEMQFRTKLMGLIRQKEQAAVPVAAPEVAQ